MGAGSSSPSGSIPEETAALLSRLAGPVATPRSDPFWTRLTSHWREPLTATDPARLEAALRSHCVSLARHDRDTAHFGALLLRAADALRASPRARPDDASVEAVNAVTLVAVILRHLADRPSDHAALHRACDPPRSPDGTPTSVSPARAFLAAVVDTLRALPEARRRRHHHDYPLRVACVRCLLACASTRARRPPTPREPEDHVRTHHPFLHALVETCSDASDASAAPSLVAALLRCVADRDPPPGKGAARVAARINPGRNASGTVASRLAAFAASALGLSASGDGVLASAGKESPLADDAASLCLALAYHRCDGRDVFRAAMRACADAAGMERMSGKREKEDEGDVDTLTSRRSARQSTGAGSSSSSASSSSAAAGVDFSRLFESLGARAGEDDRAVGVLYAALQHTPGFREYCLARGDPEILVLPLLRRVYRRVGGSAGAGPGAAGAPGPGPGAGAGPGAGGGARAGAETLNRLAGGAGTVGSDPDASLVALLILLMLSEEPSLARRVHAVPARDAPWYRERQLRDTTVGSLAVATLARAAKASSPTTSPDDAYALIITLSTLANLAPEFDRLSAHAAQRFVSLVDLLARRHARAKAALSKAARKKDTGSGSGDGDAGDGDGEDVSVPVSVPVPGEEEVLAHADFHRVAVDALNVALTRALPRNPELAYAVLHRRDLFDPSPASDSFPEAYAVARAVAARLNDRVDAGGVDVGRHGYVSTDAVMGVIAEVCAGFRPESAGTEATPAKRFEHVESEDAAAFFAPLAWRLAGMAGGAEEEQQQEENDNVDGEAEGGRRGGGE